MSSRSLAPQAGGLRACHAQELRFDPDVIEHPSDRSVVGKVADFILDGLGDLVRMPHSVFE
jgi:hypothetical protein